MATRIPVFGPVETIGLTGPEGRQQVGSLTSRSVYISQDGVFVSHIPGTGEVNGRATRLFSSRGGDRQLYGTALFLTTREWLEMGFSTPTPAPAPQVNDISKSRCIKCNKAYSDSRGAITYNINSRDQVRCKDERSCFDRAAVRRELVRDVVEYSRKHAEHTVGLVRTSCTRIQGLPRKPDGSLSTLTIASTCGLSAGVDFNKTLRETRLKPDGRLVFVEEIVERRITLTYFYVPQDVAEAAWDAFISENNITRATAKMWLAEHAGSDMTEVYEHVLNTVPAEIDITHRYGEV